MNDGLFKKAPSLRETNLVLDVSWMDIFTQGAYLFLLLPSTVPGGTPVHHSPQPALMFGIILAALQTFKANKIYLASFHTSPNRVCMNFFHTNAVWKGQYLEHLNQAEEAACCTALCPRCWVKAWLSGDLKWSLYPVSSILKPG